VTIISNDSASAKTFSSKDFLIDKSNDLIYEYGTIAHPYLWRSVVSKYENRRAELGDVAVMKWDAPGTIHLDDCTAPLPPDATLYGFGYPQGEKAATDVKYQSGRLFDYNSHNKYDCFTCNAEFNKGLSGGPVFILRKSSLHHSNDVVGITSRIADKGTLCVPSAQIRKLINILSKDGKRQ
jgi:hypothetical protein